MNEYRAGLYLRLSRDDGNQESMSIANQRAMLMEYVQERGWSVEEVYIDDGYTGTNFDRPGFTRMINDIRLGRINMVITKDLSRLGRNYVRVGEYTDFFFPKHKVRYIAVTEHIDSAKDNDIAGFLNIVNEHYAKDISRKVKSVKQSKAKRGQFIGAIPSYGYAKDEHNHNQLVIDEVASEVVKRIFHLYAIGHSARHIAEQLNKDNIISPRHYYYWKAGLPSPHSPNTWSANTILQMLKKQIYIGHMVQGTRHNPSFKMKVRELVPEEDWIIVENTHEPLIDKDTWDQVQAIINARKNKRGIGTKYKKNGEIALFSGKIRCADCGSKMNYMKKEAKGRIYHVYRCSTYNIKGKSACSYNAIREEVLEELIIKDLHRYAKIAIQDEDVLLRQIAETHDHHQANDLELIRTQVSHAKQELYKVKQKCELLMEKMLDGVITNTTFNKMIREQEQRRNELEQEISALNKSLIQTREVNQTADEMLDKFKSYIYLDKLDRESVVALIDKIVVSKRYIKDGIKQQDIDIYYNFIGKAQTKKQTA